MKILWITPWFGNYRVPLYNWLNKISDNNFYLICSKENTSDLVRAKLKTTLGNNVVIMEGEKALKLGDEKSDFANTSIVIKRQPGLYKEIKKIDADVIIVEGFGGWAPKGLFYSFLNRKKSFIYYERTAYVERNSPFWRTFYRKIIGKFVDGFIINGKLTRNYLRDLGFVNYPMVEGCMVADTENLSIDTRNVTEEQKQLIRRKYNIRSEGICFLFVGQIVDRKGIKELLEAWETHLECYPNDTLLVVGQGNLETELNDKYKEILSIVFLGKVSYDEIHNFYATTDVFIMPTLEDNWSLVVPEAMACRLPVATTIYNGCYVELIDEGKNGFSFDSQSKESIVECLGKFHGCDLKAMGLESERIVADFTPKIAARKIYDLIKMNR